MKILHLYKDYYPVLGGIENHIRALAEAQARAGHEVGVLVTASGRESGVETLNGVTVYRAGRLATVASTPLSADLARRLAALTPDITHLHFPYPIGEISQLLLNRGRTVITYHSDVVRGSQQVILRFYRPLMRLILKRAARLIATSPNYVVSSPHLRRLADRCVIVPLGVDTSQFHPASALTPNPQSPISNAQSSRPTILFLGRLRYYKGLGTLLEAMTGIDARLVVGGDGPMRAEWQALAERLGVADRVSFAGSIPDEALASFYRSGDLFVLPASARSEAFGTVLLEAMASGLACVTTELSTGTTYVVQDGVSGLVVPPHSPHALAEAIRRLLADDELRTQMGRAGLERVGREFTVEKMVERVQAVYRWATSRTAPARARRAAPQRA
jgi:glycosyltransferase involved in cell wall biosynthesis